MNTEIFVLMAGEQRGPYNAEALRFMVANGELSRRDWAWHKGLPEWRALDQVVGFDDLPPLPPSKANPEKSRSNASKPNVYARYVAQLSPLANISGALGLILLLGSVFSIGACSHAENKLQSYGAFLESPEGGAEVLLRGLDRISKGDPFGQVVDLIDTRRTLEARAAEAKLLALLFVLGTGACGVGFYLATRTKPALVA